MRSSDATEDVFGCVVRPAGKAHRFDVLSHCDMAFKYGDFKSHLKSPYLEEFIAEMETDIEKPQMEETDWKKTP